MVFTVCGDVPREGVFELPLGSPMRPGSWRKRRAAPPRVEPLTIFPGASNTVIAPEELDTPMDFDSLREVGSGLGAGGFAVFDDSACMVQAALPVLALPGRRIVRAMSARPSSARARPPRLLGGAGVRERSGRDIELVLVRSRRLNRRTEMRAPHR